MEVWMLMEPRLEWWLITLANMATTLKGMTTEHVTTVGNGQAPYQLANVSSTAINNIIQCRSSQYNGKYTQLINFLTQYSRWFPFLYSCSVPNTQSSSIWYHQCEGIYLQLYS